MMGRLILAALFPFAPALAFAAEPPPIIGDVEGQPLAQNAGRLLKALDFLGAPLAADAATPLQSAIDNKDAKTIQQILDKHVLFAVNINPEARVKVARGPAEAKLQQAGYVPVLIKIVNESTVKKPLKVGSPQSGPRYSDPGRQERSPKADPKIVDRFLQLEMYAAPPMNADLSGLKVEYAIALIYSTEAGKREATIAFDIGQGNQDLGFRGETAVLFDVQPAIPVTVHIADFDGKPTVARLTITDVAAHVFPPQPKRLGQDFFFQKQIYRPDGGQVLLPPGEFTVESGRGPEYKMSRQKFRAAPGGKNELTVKLERWIDPAASGWFSGDHHIHAAGCAHYTNPTEGVMPEDMFLHVKGEGMNVGCCLTWGPCYDFQRNFFEAGPHRLTEPFTVLKYDVEVSGFGSQALGHVCLLNLRDQTYPGSAGTKLKGWPTWTTPLMKWGKDQGAVTGYAHSANGLGVNAKEASTRLFKALANKGGITKYEAARGKWPLPDSFEKIDTNNDEMISAAELLASHNAQAGKLPNLIIPRMDGIGAQEICVTSAMGVCDFISAMDTDRVPEWNCWYHIMNCGFPLKVSGETDFPCITGHRVGQGRVYVQLGKIDHIDFSAWCQGIQEGKSYVSDGYAHALDFRVNGTAPGFGEVKLKAAGTAAVKAKVAFASKMDLGTANGAPLPVGPNRKVELIVNGKVVATRDVPADDKTHDIEFQVPIARSSWVALRHFPQMHTNAVPVLVDGKPIRASRASAKWCVGVIEKLWEVRGQAGPGPRIAAAERPEAERTFQKALEIYRKIADEAEEGS